MTYPDDDMLPASSASQRTAYDTIGRRHVDLPTGRTFEPLTVPPDGKVQVVCENYPECMCGDDCIDRTESPRARLILKGLMLAVAVLGIVLIYVGLR